MKNLALAAVLLFAPIGGEVASTDFPQTLSNPGELWFAFPAEGAPLSPFLLIGANLQPDNFVFVGVGFSPVLRSRSIRVPLLGRITVIASAVPLITGSGSSEVFMKDGLLWGTETNRLPFTVL
ncbi:MAG: hypothetical protein P8L98_00570 [Planctomycetota bacterium]|jgi:hypothetical protein|nr:hypothetical protein [Planctomycetota bacterium]